jgi:prepilin-type N-terminal cleavage/methylation domain-containing protein
MKLKGFTLVELLVVMAIVGFLSVGAFAGLSFGLRQARDVQRKKIVDLAHVALQAYYSDYAGYPRTTSAGCGRTTGITVPGWAYCTNAFPTSRGDEDTFVYATVSENGIKEYLEGEWPIGTGTSSPGTNNTLLRYYHSPASGVSKASKFAVCVSLENKNGGNVTSTSGQKDCYCVGADYVDLKCAGMTSIAN